MLKTICLNFLLFLLATFLLRGESVIAQTQSNTILQLPTSGTVTQLFNTPDSFYTSGRHSGVDTSGYRSINDTDTVVAAAAGKVVFIRANRTADYGDFVVIYHGILNSKHVYTLYGHMGNRNRSTSDNANFITVKLGQDVLAGTPLGRQGNSGTIQTLGNGLGIHLHWEVLVSSTPITEIGNSIVWTSSRLNQLSPVSPNDYCGYNLTYGDSNSKLNQTVAAPAFVRRSTDASWQPDGTIINEGGTLHLIEGGRRRGFQSADRFTSSGYDFTQAITTTAPSCLDNGDLINAPPTYRFYRQQNGEIYFITDRNRKRVFTSYAAYLGRFDGSSLQNYELNNIQNDATYFYINTPFHEGTLVRQNGSQAVYVISNGNARLIDSATAFSRLGYRWKDVIVLSSEVFATIGRDDLHPITSSLIDSCDGDVGGASDEFAPDLSINTPANGQTVYTNSINVSGTASDGARGESGVSSVTINGSRASNDTATVSTTANWSGGIVLSPGTNNITVVARDNSPAQNAATKTITVYYQTAGSTPTPTPTPTPPAAASTFTSAAAANPNPATVGQSVSVQSSFNSSSAAGAADVIVNTEIYNAADQRVFQGLSEHQNFSAGQTLAFVYNWTPSAAGDYKVKTSVFNANWTSNYHWNDTALTITIGSASPTPTPTPPAASPSFSSTATAAPNPALVASPINVSATVANSGGSASDVIVDVEIYNAADVKVFQSVYEHRNFTAGSSQTFTPSWTPAATGQYTVKIGVFSNDWSRNYSWNANAATISISSSSQPPAPAYNISVWWVADGATVSGTQPFKAVIDNLSLSQYQMFWQVDGGGLIPMSDSLQDAPHKESMVDLSGWTWRGTGAYTVNFVAKDSSGSIIAQRAVSIYVSP